VALAPAKLNLYLDVLGGRPDGYHELESLFVALAWGDDLEVEARPEGVSLAVLGDAQGLPAEAQNLAFRAAVEWLALARGTAGFGGAHLRLEKRVPVGGGLGGGSADAGAALRALEALAGPARGAGAPRLHALAARLGADVPFFLGADAPGASAVGRGRGDVLEPLPPAPPLHVVLVMPPWGHSTAAVFAHAGQRHRRGAGLDLAGAVRALASGEPARVRDAHWNALALPAMRAYPAFTRFTSEVERRLGRPPCLTGSGSTLYDVADDAEDAQRQAQRLDGLGARVVVARTR
jgi:4-diphosphocytidyl-2-C-methyl-D-erythritol kinase